MAASLWRSSGEIGDVVKNRIGESVTSDSHLQKEKIGSLTNRKKKDMIDKIVKMHVLVKKNN